MRCMRIRRVRDSAWVMYARIHPKIHRNTSIFHTAIPTANIQFDVLSSRVLNLHARVRTASVRCNLTPRGLIKAHSMHLLAIGAPMFLGKQVPHHIATANTDWKHTTNRAAMARETLQIKCIHAYCRATIAHSVDAEGSNRATHLAKLGTHSSLLSLQAPCLEACVELLDAAAAGT